MTQIDHQSETVQDHRVTSLATWLAWGVIWAAAIFIVGSHYLLSPAHVPPPLENPEERPGITLQLASRHTLGMHLVGESLDEPLHSQLSNPSLAIETLRSTAGDDPLDQFRISPVIAELQGADAAISHLDDLLALQPPPPDQTSDPAPVETDPTPDADAASASPAPLTDTAWPDAFLHDIETLRTLYVFGPDDITDADRDDLRRRHDWFGELAATWGRPDSPERERLLAQARRGAIVMVSLITVALAAGGLGLILLTLFIVLLATGRMKRRYPPSRALLPIPHSVCLETMALFLSAFIGLQFLMVALVSLGVPEPAAGLSIWLVTPLPLIWPVIRGYTFNTTRLALGFHAGAGVFREIGWGILGYIAGLPIVALGFGLTFVLVQLFDAAPSHPAIDEMGAIDSVLGLLLIYSLACLWAPITEELVFRGALFHHLRQRWSPIASALLVAFLFAAIHPQGFATIPALMSLAIVFALLRELRGSLIPSMTGHAIHNGILITVNALVLIG